ncbi:hypothetical protein FS749_002906 [Ceratobasidium sp. UAMH 11750]|nr:hypothetical protein FS749_002906 [Ceratobasidium sp. UAMH 11750]
MRLPIFSLGLAALLATGQCIRLTSWNIRYDWDDKIPVSDTIASLPSRLKQPSPYYPKASTERPWSSRRIGVAALLQFQASAVISFQEASAHHVRDMKTLLGNDWDWVGLGRDGGKADGEMNPIFFDKTQVQLKSWDIFWLTDTPFEFSQYPGAGSVRICTAARLSVGGKNLTVLHTHLDHLSDAQRRLGASLILHRARYEAATTGATVFIKGDMNSPTEGQDNGAYKIFTGALPPVAINSTFASRFPIPENSPLPSNFTMLDTRGTTPREKVVGHFATFTGFHNLGDTSEYGRIDFVFGDSHAKWKSVAYMAAEILYDDGVYLSDHRPVTVDVVLP